MMIVSRIMRRRMFTTMIVMRSVVMLRVILVWMMMVWRSSFIVIL